MVLMLVDDDVDDIFFFHEALRSVNPEIKCITFQDGREALRFFETNEPPCIVFLDINMPSMNGMEMLKKIRAMPQLQELCIVMYSTSISADQIEIFKQSGAAYATKGDTIAAWEQTVQNQITLAKERTSTSTRDLQA
jgi:CheY-like chemotaxis protein